MISSSDLIRILTKETATTLKVMRAFPETQADFAPHERSSTAKKLMKTFVFEMYLAASYVFGDELDRGRFATYDPDTLAEIIEDFRREATQVANRLSDLSPGDLQKTVEFGGATLTKDDYMLMMIHDQIHHRGQLTVYVRMAGGKVPSVYGPSADDSSTNL